MPPVGTSRGVECAAYGCNSRFYNKDLSRSPHHFFSFPTDPKRRDRWCMKIKRTHGCDGFFVGKSTIICNLHFKAEDIKRTLTGIWRLKPGAEPAEVLSDSTSPRKLRFLPRSYRENESLSACSTDEGEETIINDEEAIIEDILDEKDVLINALKTESERLKDKVTEVDKSVERLQSEIGLRNEKGEQSKFVSTMVKDDSLTKHYTGFHSFSLLLAMLSFLNPGNQCENVVPYYSANTNSKPPSSHQPASVTDMDHSYAALHKTVNKPARVNLSAKEQFILTLCRLKRGFSVKHLGYLFDISESTVSLYFAAWITFMNVKLGPLVVWPSKDLIQNTMPQTFREKYPATRVIIGCSEISAQVPETMFHSKHHITYKGLLGVAPSGTITFISELYPGSLSDREVVLRSGLVLKHFDKDDVVMAGRGFNIQDLLRPMGVKLNSPGFPIGKEHAEIAATNLQIKRAVNKVKKFRIFDRPISLTVDGSVNQIWIVCCILSNYFKHDIARSTVSQSC